MSRHYFSIVNVLSPAYDADAQAFFTAASIIDDTQKSAVNTLVVALKDNGIWTKMIAIYPFVGSTATNQKYNLKDTSAYTLTFASGVTHSTAGMKINVGSAEYADTSFAPSSGWSAVDNASIGAYQSLGTPSGKHNFGIDGAVGLRASAATTIYPLLNDTTYSSFVTGSPEADRIGFQQITRNTSGNSGKFMKLHDNPVANPSFYSTGNTLSGDNIYFGRPNGGTIPGTDNNIFTFAYIGTALSTTDLDNYYTVVQAFNTTLSRQHT